MSSQEELLQEALQKHLDGLTKPVGSLGKLEDYALKLGMIQKKVPPVIQKKVVYVFAGDHGVVDEGVSLYPKEVTAQMMANFTSGGAAINVLARHCGFEVFAVDAGVDGLLEQRKEILDYKVMKGSRNFIKTSAMTKTELETSLANGKDLAKKTIEAGYSLAALGDMGIGNTTTSAALLVAAGFSAEEIVDRGTGIDDQMLTKKFNVVQQGVKTYQPYQGAEDILMHLGSPEMAMMTGFILGLKGSGIACLIDGFPVTSAAYMAYMIDPSITDFLFAGHQGKVRGHAPVLKKMGLDPIVAFDMRLGEGTGAVIGGFMVDLASKIACEMASFESAGISQSQDEEKKY